MSLLQARATQRGQLSSLATGAACQMDGRCGPETSVGCLLGRTGRVIPGHPHHSLILLLEHLTVPPVQEKCWWVSSTWIFKKQCALLIQGEGILIKLSPFKTNKTNNERSLFCSLVANVGPAESCVRRGVKDLFLLAFGEVPQDAEYHLLFLHSMVWTFLII